MHLFLHVTALFMAPQEKVTKFDMQPPLGGPQDSDTLQRTAGT